MKYDDPHLFDLGMFTDNREVESSRIAEQIRLGRLYGTSSIAGLTNASDEHIRAVLARHNSALSVCRDAAGHLEPSFLLAHEHREQMQAHGQQREAFLAGFRNRLTFVGTDVVPRSWSHIAWINDDPAYPLAFSRDSGQVTLVAGIQGSGKTVLSSVLCEGCFPLGLPLCSDFMLPTCFAFFHLEEQDRLPQLLDGLKPNPTQRDLEILMQRLGVTGRGLSRLRLVVPDTLLPDLMPRLQPYIDLGLEVMPLKVHLGQLGQPGLEAALGAESGAGYIQRILEDAQDQGKGLRIDRLYKFIDDAKDLNESLKRLARARLRVLLDIAAKPGQPGMWQMYEPGVATVAYLGGPHMGRARMTAILVALLGALVMPSPEHGAFQRMIVADEVDLLSDEPGAWQAFTRIGRVVRHRGASLVLMGQDLLGAPDELFGLAGQGYVFQLRNPRVFEFLRDRIGALRGRRWEDVVSLGPGEALLGATVTTAPWWQQSGRHIKVRPLLCEHGGWTRSMT